MYVDILILSILNKQPRHGYEIKRLAGTLGSLFLLNNNHLYPALKKFEQQGAVVKTVEIQEKRPNRHVYQTTPKGYALLIELLHSFTEREASDQVEFFVRVGNFEYIDLENRMRMLYLRESYLRGRLAGVRDVVSQNPLMRVYPARLFQFVRRDVMGELAWIEEMKRDVLSVSKRPNPKPQDG